MKKFLLLGACVMQLLATGTLAAANRVASVAIVWRVPAPQSPDADVQAVEAGISAVSRLDPQLNAIATNPRGRATFALDPEFIAALQQLAAGKSALPELADNRLMPSDPRAAELLDVFSKGVSADGRLAASAAGRRFTAHSAAARLALMGDSSARFSTRDEVDFAAIATLLALASGGYAHDQMPLLDKDNLNGRDLRTLADSFAFAARAVLAKIKSLAAKSSLEIAALPAYEPIVPLVIDAAGRTRQAPFTVNLGGRSDAAAAVEDGMRAVTALSGAPEVGVLSPHGAYDDETAVVLQEHNPAYAIFSERVVRASTGASAEAVNASKAAALRGYLLETSKTSKLPILFSSDSLATELDVLPSSSPATALGDRIRDMAQQALTSSGQSEATVLLLCLDTSSPLLHRPDRAAMLAHLTTVLTRGNGLEATTPLEFLHRHPATAETYGFEPASDAGGFGLWMGSANQASLWTALWDARRNAGGDAALTHRAVRAALLRAESNRWFMALSLPQPRAALERSLTQFRSAIARIYRAANAHVPSEIAPVKWESPATIATPQSTRM